MSQHLTDLQSTLLRLARRGEGISNLEAGRLIEAADPLERTIWELNEQTGERERVRKPGVIGIEARGRRRLRNMAADGWLTWDDDDQVWRVGGGSRLRQRSRRPHRPAQHPRRRVAA